jgi:hypothetical protein
MLTTKQPISRTRAPAKSKRPSAKSAPAADVTHESIARRAYELYMSRGPHEGDALADWFRAERELSATASSA